MFNSNIMVFMLIVPKLYSLIIKNDTFVNSTEVPILEKNTTINIHINDTDYNYEEFLSSEDFDYINEDKAAKNSNIFLQKLLGFENVHFDSQYFGNNVILPQFISELYESVINDEKNSKPHGSDVVWSLFEKDPSKNDIFKFSLNGISEKEDILEAELHIYRIGVDQQNGYPPYYLLRVYQIMPTGYHTYLNPDVHQLLNVHYIPAFATGWQVFKVTRAVLSWLRGNEPNFGLLVTATTILGEPVEIRFAKRGLQSDKYQPTLVLFTKDKNQKNSGKLFHKDDENNFDNKNETNNCKKEQLLVNFSDIHWNKNIVLPKSFDLGKCVGNCNLPLENGKNYGFVQSALEEFKINKLKEPCCIPTKLNYLTIVYFDKNNNLLLKTIENMIIDNCGCY